MTKEEFIELCREKREFVFVCGPTLLTEIDIAFEEYWRRIGGGKGVSAQ